MKRGENVCETCGCSETGKPIKYECECGDDCACNVIEFDEEPQATPYCCGVPMKRAKWGMHSLKAL